MSIKKMVASMFINIFPTKLLKSDVLGAVIFPNKMLLVAYIEDKKITVMMGSYLCVTFPASVNDVLKNGYAMEPEVAKSLFLTHCSSTIPDGVTW